MTIPLCKDWPVPRLSSKFRLPWVDQIFDLRNDCNQGVHKNIPCITHVALEQWNSMTAQEIRGALPPKPGPLRRFNAACKRLVRFKDCLERFKQSQLLEMTSAHMCLNLCGLLLKNVLAARNFLITRLNLGISHVDVLSRMIFLYRLWTFGHRNMMQCFYCCNPSAASCRSVQCSELLLRMQMTSSSLIIDFDRLSPA